MCDHALLEAFLFIQNHGLSSNNFSAFHARNTNEHQRTRRIYEAEILDVSVFGAIHFFMASVDG